MDFAPSLKPTRNRTPHRHVARAKLRQAKVMRASRPSDGSGAPRARTAVPHSEGAGVSTAAHGPSRPGGVDMGGGPNARWRELRHDPNRLIEAYAPMARSLAWKVCRGLRWAGGGDEISVALCALYEASRSYRPEMQIPFAAFAAIVVRRRLVDYVRRARRWRGLPFSMWDQLDAEWDAESKPERLAAEHEHRQRNEAKALLEEVDTLKQLLGQRGITLADVARQAPRHRDARERAVAVARLLAASPEWSHSVHLNGRLLLRQSEPRWSLLGMSRKTIERRRRFIVAIVLILSNGLNRLAHYLPSGDPHEYGTTGGQLGAAWAGSRASLRG